MLQDTTDGLSAEADKIVDDYIEYNNKEQVKKHYDTTH